MASEDNPVVLASNSLVYAMARREVGTPLREAVAKLYEAAEALRGIGLIPGSMKLEKIAGSLSEQFEIDEDGDALAYLD